MGARGFILAAASSGAGKTTVTLGLMRALARRGIDVRAAKSGPDYIDPAFHAVACGHPSVNLDGWAMAPDLLRARAASQGGTVLIVEGAMGVLDAGADGRGSVADLARALGLPVVLVLDIAKQGQSAALAPAGLRALCPDLDLAGVIVNRAGSARHVALASARLREAGFPVLGALPRDAGLALPERHLGLVQASETAGLSAFLDHAADQVEAHLDLEALLEAAVPLAPARPDLPPPDLCSPDLRPADLRPPDLHPPAQVVAVAHDRAFGFLYPHLLDDWRAAGAEVLPFSPLADAPPDPRAQAIHLPGGYPELHAGALAGARRFREGMQRAAAAGVAIYGECGGYMVLGRGIEDASGARHAMLDLLPLETSFARRRLTLGYRRLTPCPGAPFEGPLMAHEFHYATILQEGAAERLFEARDGAGAPLPAMGLRRGRVCGSFAHVIAKG